MLSLFRLDFAIYQSNLYSSFLTNVLCRLVENAPLLYKVHWRTDGRHTTDDVKSLLEP